MKKLTLLIAILVILVSAVFAQQQPVRVKIGPKAEDPSMLLIYYATTPDLQCHFVTKSDVLVGPWESTIPNSTTKVYKVVSIKEPVIMYLDKQWTYVYNSTADGAQGFYSEIPIDKIADGPHDINWKLQVTYQKNGKSITEEAYALADWSKFAISKDVKGSRDPGKYHFEFWKNSTKSPDEMIKPVIYQE
jgi:hypothetical protein